MTYNHNIKLILNVTNPIHWENKFQNLHIVWTTGKNLALPDPLSRNTPPEFTGKITVEMPQNINSSLPKTKYHHD